jgi:hypothetical protein
VRDYARNVKLLRKLKEDAMVDLVERTATAAAMQEALASDVVDDDRDDADDVNTDDGAPDDFARTNTTSIDDGTLRLSYQLIRRRWRSEEDDYRPPTCFDQCVENSLPRVELPSLSLAFQQMCFGQSKDYNTQTGERARAGCRWAFSVEVIENRRRREMRVRRRGAWKKGNGRGEERNLSIHSFTLIVLRSTFGIRWDISADTLNCGPI